MRAAIDVGSNSVRLGLSDGEKYSTITKLADGLNASGALSRDGAERSLRAISEYVKKATDTGCRACDIKIFATEAVRRARDGALFCDKVKTATGISVTVLSPEDEARYALLGAKKPSGAVSVCDLGGGSMELISSFDGVTPEYVKSLPLGVVVLKNTFDGDYRKAIDAAPALVAEYGETKNYPLVMIGGSACSIAAAEKNLRCYDKTAVNGAYISAARLDELMPILLSPKLSVFRPVCAKRADTLPYGAIIIQALLNHIGARGFYVSDSDNLDAALNMK